MAGPNDSKRDALIAEGLTPAEADYMTSGGTKTDGLALPADTGADTSGAAAAAPEAAKDVPAASSTDAQAGTGAAGAAATVAPAAGDDDGDPEPPKDSPFYQQWHREKRRRQQLQTELRERDERLNTTTATLSDMQQRWARLDERFRVFQEAATAPTDPNAGQPKPPPDRETDPFGWMTWAHEKIEALEGRTGEVVNQAQEQQAVAALTTTFRSDAVDYTRANPDFWESTAGARDGAYHFLMRSRDAELQAAGYRDPAERLKIITLDERDIVARALHERQQNPQAPRPAEVLFNLAVARGYQKRAAPAPTDGAGNGAAANGAGGAPAATNGVTNGAAAANGGTPSVTQQVEQIARGQAASRSLSSGGGAPVPQGIDLARLAAMNDGEYLEYMRSLTPAQRKEYQSLIGAPK